MGMSIDRVPALRCQVRRVIGAHQEGSLPLPLRWWLISLPAHKHEPGVAKDSRKILQVTHDEM